VKIRDHGINERGSPSGLTAQQLQRVILIMVTAVSLPCTTLCGSISRMRSRFHRDGNRRRTEFPRNNRVMKAPVAIGIDFGTTNSSAAMVTPAGAVRLATFPTATGSTSSFRSVLYLEQMRKSIGARRVRSQSVPAAIEAYLEAEEKGRLIQSLKSWLPDHMFTGTEVFGRWYSIEELMSRILMDLRHRAEELFQMPIRHVTAGRPVCFVGANSDDDDAYALSRLHSAFLKAGFETVQFELEPVAAAHSDELTVDREGLILIGDFGGGTSDFSLLRVASDLTGREPKPHELLGSNGVGLAGDAFDARIIRKLVSPAFGAGSQARSLNKLLPAVPAWIYGKLNAAGGMLPKKTDLSGHMKAIVGRDRRLTHVAESTRQLLFGVMSCRGRAHVSCTGPSSKSD